MYSRSNFDNSRSKIDNSRSIIDNSRSVTDDFRRVINDCKVTLQLVVSFTNVIFLYYWTLVV
jgi:hypothetical protein